MKEQRFKQAEFAAWVGIIGNILLAAVKGVAGAISNSKALIADAAHSASDVAGSIAVLIGLRAAQLPPDKDHPYGHGKAENISAIIVSVILFFVGIEVGYSSIKGLFVEDIKAPGTLAIYATILSILVKESMFQYKYRLGKRINSPAVIANALEHRSDVYSSLGALIGIGGAVLGGKYQIGWLLYLDPLAGAIVAILIIKMAYGLGKETIHNTLDRVLQDEETKEYIQAVENIVGVMHVDEFFAREHGHYVIVDLKIAVNPKITVEQGHQIGKEVKRTLMKDFKNIQDVFVHINPYQTTYNPGQIDEPFLIQ